MADDHQPDPETIVERLRAVRAMIGDLTVLTVRDRRTMRRLGKISNAVLHASINIIGAHDAVERAVAHTPEAVRRMDDEANRWTAVEHELRTMLESVYSANLIRRRQIALITTQAYNIGRQLVRDPANAVLLPHVEEIQRLKSFARRKKRSAEEPEDPQP